MRDRTPSKQFNCKLALDVHEMLERLVAAGAYQTQREAVEVAVRLLDLQVSIGSTVPYLAGEVSKQPVRVVSPPPIQRANLEAKREKPKR